MNNKRGELLIAAVEAEKIAKFNMRWLFTLEDQQGMYLQNALPEVTCNTPACLAGMAALLSKKKQGYTVDVAATWLGLEGDEAAWLFNGDFSWRADGAGFDFLTNVTKKEAIAALRWLMDGNSIEDWTADPVIDEVKDE